jgi:hypothetical protein
LEDFVELALHGDHLFAHVERNLGAFQIHSHFVDEEVGDAHAIDLIHGIKFVTAPHDRRDHLLLFQAHDELFINPADFSHLGYAEIFSRHFSSLPLQPHVFAHVFAVSLVDLFDNVVGNLILRHMHHKSQIQIAGWSLAMGGDSLAFDPQLLAALRTGWNFDLDRSTGCRHLHLGTANRFADPDR